MAETTYHSPLGLLRLREAHGHLTHLDWGPALETEPPGEPGPQDDDSPLLNRAVHQLNAYFFCGLRHFDLPLAPQGTAFQRAVWQQMQAIPYGDTRTYGEIARWLRSAPRPVGTACGRNPIPIVIPCHRVVASDGLGGYSGDGGADTKQWLLELEGWSADRPRTLFDTPAPDAAPNLGLQ
ncbi:MAG: methylated-DNA--[protein]-cysteine S-methyltransferase [Rhodospirillaceae bacterium]|nr:methylated-DNA--[protein]-cysteine S-methyltransferase [Rhodospirillaceae bacterium]